LKIHALIDVGIFGQSTREGVQILTIGCALEILMDEESPTTRELSSASGSTGSGVVGTENYLNKKAVTGKL
jgi:hypothetical protein